MKLSGAVTFTILLLIALNMLFAVPPRPVIKDCPEPTVNEPPKRIIKKLAYNEWLYFL